MNKFLLITDLEGVSGAESFKDMRPGGPGNLRAKEILTDDVNCVIASIRAYGRKANRKCEIHIWDGHGSGGLLREKIINSSEVSYYPSQWSGMTKLLGERQIDAILFIDQHAMGKTPKANLCHTFSRKRVNYFLINGNKHGTPVRQFIGEIGFRAALGSELGVPTIFLSGDDKAVLEAKKVIPGIMTVTTKYGDGLEKANFRKLEDIRSEITIRVKKALQKKIKDEKRFYKLNAPLELEIGCKSYIGLFLNLFKGAIWKGNKIARFKANTFSDLETLRIGKESYFGIIKQVFSKLKV